MTSIANPPYAFLDYLIKKNIMISSNVFVKEHLCICHLHFELGNPIPCNFKLEFLIY